MCSVGASSLVAIRAFVDPLFNLSTILNKAILAVLFVVVSGEFIVANVRNAPLNVGAIAA